MSAERWDELKDTFAALVDLPVDERALRLAALASSDAALHRRLEALLDADMRADSALGRLPLASASDSLGAEGNGAAGRMGDPFGLSGRTISHFRVLDVLGAGGMGVVYRATDERLGRVVALKLPLPQYALDPIAKQRFLQEARAASSLDHPNVCTVYETGESADGQPFLAMACYDGETLRARLASSGAVPVGEAIQIARALLGALDAAHAAGVVHRDLKPGNVMLTADGTVKILDFGLAKVRDLSLTDAGNRPGTAAYMSPEQLRGEAVDGRTDLWSLGAVLYEMFTGRPPFGGGHELSTVYAILHDDPKPLSRIRPEVPAEYAAIVARLLRKLPDDRFISADAVLAALSLPQQARSRTGSTRARNGRRLILALVAAAAIAGVSAMVTAHRAADSFSARGRTRSIAVLPFVDMSGNSANEHFVNGLTDELITALGRDAELRVAARTSVFYLKAKGLSSRAIADSLGVDHVLEVRVRRDPGTIAATAHLVRASDGAILFAKDFERPAADVFALQDEIARSVLAAFGRSTGTALVEQPTRDLDAFELYLHGKSNEIKRSKADLDSAAAYFHGATKRDTKFALAFAGLADVYVANSNYGFKPWSEMIPLAEAAADSAIKLDSLLGEAYASKGMVLASRGKFAAADQAFRHAIRLNPNAPWSHHFYSLLLTMQRRTGEALSENKRARLLDPFAPAPNSHFGVLLSLEGDSAGARTALRATVGLTPVSVVSLYYLGVMEAADGRYVEALRLLDSANVLAPGFPGVRPALAYTYARLGRRASADGMLAMLRSGRDDDRSRIDRALADALMGDIDRAFETLGHARWDIPSAINFRVNPLLGAFRRDPRYERLLAEMGLDP